MLNNLKMAEVMTARSPTRSSKTNLEYNLPATPSSKSPPRKKVKDDSTKVDDKKEKRVQKDPKYEEILLQLKSMQHEITQSIKSTVQDMFYDLEKKLEEKIAQEITKYLQQMEEKLAKDAEKKIKKLEDGVNESINFLEHEFNRKLSEVRSHAILNEQYSRKSSLRVFGIQEKKDEDVEEEVIGFFKEKMNVSILKSDIDITHRVGKPSKDQKRPRGIIVKFLCHKNKEKVMRKKRNLKDTPYRIQEDLAPEIYRRVKEVRRTEGIERSWTVDGKIKFKKEGEDRIYMIRNEIDMNKFRFDFGISDYKDDMEFYMGQRPRIYFC